MNGFENIIDTKIEVNSSVIYQDLGGELVLLNTESGAYYSLNELGAKIWVLLKEDRSLSQIFDSLFNQYEVSRERLVIDIEKFVHVLVTDGLATTG